MGDLILREVKVLPKKGSGDEKPFPLGIGM